MAASGEEEESCVGEERAKGEEKEDVYVCGRDRCVDPETGMREAGKKMVRKEDDLLY